MKKIGIIGLARNAESMIKHLVINPGIEIIGMYDTDFERALRISQNTKLEFTTNPFGLIAQSDLLIIPKTDENSFNLIIESILNSKHVIIENPVYLSINEIEMISKLALEASVSVVPFLPFRFNSCLLSTKSYIYNPDYLDISYKTLPEFKKPPIGNSDIIINVIDLVLNLVKANVKKVFANAVRVVSASPQLVIIRLEFDNGCTASISFDFISTTDELQITVYQPKQIVYIDLVRNTSNVKTFKSNNVLEYEVTKPDPIVSDNPYNEALNYLNAFEAFDTPVSLIESFKKSLIVLKKIEDKLVHFIR